MPTLKNPGSPRKNRDLKEITMILEAHDQHRLGAVNLERIIMRLGVHIPHNRIHEVLRMNGKATPQPRQQRRRSWVRYERTHNMSLWHMDWKQLSTGERFLAIMDDATRLIVAYGVYRQATIQNTVTLNAKIQSFINPRRMTSECVTYTPF